MEIAQKQRIILSRMQIPVEVHIGAGVVRFARQALAIAFVGATLAAAGSIGAHEPDPEEIAKGSLIDAELGFARMSLEQGMRAAFLANFAADGVAFDPRPFVLREKWSKVPAPADPHAVRLEWSPAQVGVSRGQDMGFSTGPSSFVAKAHPGDTHHGVYFSVWTRSGTAPWKVSVDMGISTPAAADFATLGAAPRARFEGDSSNREVERKILAAREDRMFEFRAGSPYAKFLADDARLYRNGRAPLAGRYAVAAWQAAHVERAVWTPQAVRIARSADIAVSYGRVRETPVEGAAREGGYVHLWLRDRRGAWRLAYDIAIFEGE